MKFKKYVALTAGAFVLLAVTGCDSSPGPQQEVAAKPSAQGQAASAAPISPERRAQLAYKTQLSGMDSDGHPGVSEVEMSEGLLKAFAQVAGTDAELTQEKIRAHSRANRVAGDSAVSAASGAASGVPQGGTRLPYLFMMDVMRRAAKATEKVTVSKVEFEKSAVQLFGELDENKDGTLMAEELKNWRPAAPWKVARPAPSASQ